MDMSFIKFQFIGREIDEGDKRMTQDMNIKLRLKDWLTMQPLSVTWMKGLHILN